MNIKPFKINIPKKTLGDLRERLSRTRFPDEVCGAAWDYGTNLAYQKELCGYWQNRFDWREQEEKLNQFAHFRAEVNGFGIHFIRERGTNESTLPLVLLHGFPSSFLQLLKIIPLLSDPEKHGGKAADSFDVIVPSLPGYGFSDRPTEKGMNVEQIAEIFHELLTKELGYKRFAVRASDLGAGVSKELALAHPDSVIALHHSGTSPFIMQMPKDLSANEKKFIKETEQFQMQEGAYAMLQSSKPQTLGYGLNDSPSGLAAWIVEKFRSWSDCEGEIEKRFSKDELLTNLTIYWATETINSAMRLYHETAHVPSPNADKRVETPTAMGMLPKDLVHGPREWHEREYNIVRWTQLPRGGHFAEWEEPELLAEDVREFFRDFR